MSDAFRPDADTRCDTCGRYGAYRLESESLCPECYEKRGTCCPEFGAEDFWREKDEPPRQS